MQRVKLKIHWIMKLSKIFTRIFIGGWKKRMNYFIIHASIILSPLCYLLLYLLIRQTKLIHRLQFNATTSTPCHVTYVNTAITNDNHRSRNFHYSGRTTLQSTVPASILFNKQRIPSTVRARHIHRNEIEERVSRYIPRSVPIDRFLSSISARRTRFPWLNIVHRKATLFSRKQRTRCR